MMKSKNIDKRRMLTVFALSISYSTIYLVVYLKYILAAPMAIAFGITEAQIGTIMTGFGVACMLLYIPGGYFADKFDTKKILVLSLGGNVLVCAMLAIWMSYPMALIAWILFGFTTAFAFWAALIKGVNSVCTPETKGRMFSQYAIFAAICSIVFNLLAQQICGFFYNPEKGLLDAETGIRAVIILGAIASLIALLFVLFAFSKKVKTSEIVDEEKFELAHVKKLIKNPIIWYVSILLFSIYAIRVCGNTYFNFYLEGGPSASGKGIASSIVSTVALIRTTVIPLCTPIFGLLIDKVFKSTAKMFTITFIVLAGLMALFIFIPMDANNTIMIILTLIPALFYATMYGLIFSLWSECKIPMAVVGTATGIASIFGYIPDFLMDLIAGNLLVSYGNLGFKYIFIMLLIIAVIGFVISVLLTKQIKKNNDNKLLNN